MGNAENNPNGSSSFFFSPPASKLISPLAVPQWFFCACNLGFSLGKDTGCTQEITQRQPPAITRTHARTHSLQTTNTETTMGGVKDESRGRTARFLPKCHKSCPFFPPRGWRLRRAVAATALMLAKKSLRTFFFFFFPHHHDDIKTRLIKKCQRVWRGMERHTRTGRGRGGGKRSWESVRKLWILFFFFASSFFFFFGTCAAFLLADARFNLKWMTDKQLKTS